ncbi:MAG TPA: HPF/RaiA family ribosome-associated protein [Usitatibacter sp.]|nr:HPF/RaiA family ribosome-associated protein [Usitatibacter sp.]
MQSTQITLHNIRRSPALSARIRELAERLETHHPEILNIRVAVSHETGPSRKGGPFSVVLRVRIRGHELVASRESDEDVYVALRDAFLAMRHQLVQAVEAARAAARAPAKIVPEVQS